MWPETFEFIRLTLAVICTSAAVKLVDDFLDMQHDNAVGFFNWAEVLGRGTLIYAMLFLVIGAALYTPLSLTLFLSSYIVGMFNDLNKLFPSRLSGLGESLLVGITGLIIFGLHLMMFSLCFVIFIQLLDDCIDLKIDNLAGKRNLAYRVGPSICLLLAIAFLLLAWNIDEQLIVPTLTGTAIVYIVSLYLTREKI